MVRHASMMNSHLTSVSLVYCVPLVPTASRQDHAPH